MTPIFELLFLTPPGIIFFITSVLFLPKWGVLLTGSLSTIMLLQLTLIGTTRSGGGLVIVLYFLLQIVLAVVFVICLYRIRIQRIEFISPKWGALLSGGMLIYVLINLIYIAVTPSTSSGIQHIIEFYSYILASIFFTCLSNVQLKDIIFLSRKWGARLAISLSIYTVLNTFIYIPLVPYGVSEFSIGLRSTLTLLFYITILALITLYYYRLIRSRSDKKIHVLADSGIYIPCFSFEKGVVTYLSEEWDLMLKLPNGLASNNAELNKKFKCGGIIDLGPVDFDEINDVAESNYQPALEPEEIIEGHCYLVKTSTGRKFAKIEIITFSDISKTIKFRWQLANDSRKFSVLNEAQIIKT